MHRNDFVQLVHEIASEIENAHVDIKDTLRANPILPGRVDESLTFEDVAIRPSILTHVKSRDEVDVTTDFMTIYDTKVEMFPLFGASMEFMWDKVAESLHGAGAMHILPRVGRSEDARVQVTKSLAEKGIKFGVAVGLNDSMEFLKDVLNAAEDKVQFFSIDVAHGASLGVAEYMYKVWREFGITNGLIVGNVGSWQGALFLIKVAELLEFDSLNIKVGIGPGAACTTRTKTGVGLGQMTALAETISAINLWANTVDVRIISDGGITKPADFVKALSLSHAVMVGKYLTSHDFDGKILKENNKEYFTYYGMASKKAKDTADDYVEGGVIKAEVNFATSAEAVKSLEYGLRSAMTYVNTKTLEDFWARAASGWFFSRNSMAAIHEGGLH